MSDDLIIPDPQRFGSQSGLGIGLTLLNSLVEMHGGHTFPQPVKAKVKVRNSCSANRIMSRCACTAATT
jgi:hypothetical protein